MKKNYSTRLSSASKFDNLKEVKEYSIELFHDDGKDNEVKSSGVVINNFGLKVLDILCEEKVERRGMKSKELVESDDKKGSWVAFDIRCKGSEIINGSKIRDDIVSDVPLLFQSSDDIHKFLNHNSNGNTINDLRTKNVSNGSTSVIMTTKFEKTKASI
ncbi:hypothetical protein Tco_1068696 [Tanacetum coccineum]|uniref:Uncharacterized protein n=1 Tax=Tanacetum coccineum TaxID=301880 RepID=A0ABQ5HGL7_9ASTR